MTEIRTMRRRARVLAGLSALAASVAIVGSVGASASTTATASTIRNQSDQALLAGSGNNSPVQFGFFSGANSGKWEKRPSPTTSGYEVWFNRGSGRCLDVQNDSGAAGARIVVRDCDGTASQDWLKQIAINGQRPFINRNSGLQMTESGSVTQQTSGTGINQLFRVRFAS